MAWFNRVFHNILGYLEPRKEICDDSILGRFPPELLYLIRDHLDLADQACLSLCNRSLRYKIGTSATDVLKQAHLCREVFRRCNIGRATAHPVSEEESQRESFLWRLSRDHPRYFYCYDCKVLQRSSLLHPPRADYDCKLECRQRGRDYYANFAQGLYDRGSAPDFDMIFQHLQLVMLRHRYGANYGMALDALAWAEVRTCDRSGITTLLSVEPSIISGELYLRIQQWLVMPPNLGQNTSSQLSVLEHCAPAVCTHVPGRHRPAWLSDIYRCRLSHKNANADCPWCHTHLHCQICSVDYQIDIKNLENGRTAMILTKWLNLGQGITPADWKWQRHLERSPVGSPPVAERNDARELFEQQQEKTLEDLVGEHAMSLHNGAFRTTFKRYWSRQSFFEDYENRNVWIRYAYPMKPIRR